MADSERFEKALLDPSDIYENPQELLSDAQLTTEQKIEVLRRWAYDASEIDVAEGEGMRALDEEVFHQVMLALEKLGAKIDPSRRPPTRQGGYDRESLRNDDSSS
jgi:hypothetical protein